MIINSDSGVIEASEHFPSSVSATAGDKSLQLLVSGRRMGCLNFAVQSERKNLILLRVHASIKLKFYY